MKKFITAAIFAGISLSAFAAETIRFATEASYPPFEFVDANNKIQGFDIDLANALCKEMQADCTFTHQAFDSLIPGLKVRRFDAVIAGIDITPERQQQVIFTKPYYDNSALFIALKDNIADITGLKGKRVGIQNGTTHQKFLMEQHAEMTAVPYDSYQNAILDLKNGRLDAIFGDTAAANVWLKQNNMFTTVGNKITDSRYFGAGLGIALRQNNTQLRDKLNTALHEVQQKGTYQLIYKKWFQ